MASYDGSLIFDTKIDTKGFSSGTNTIKSQANSLKSTFASLGKVIASAFILKKSVDVGKQAMELASDLQEVQNVVDVAFGEMAYKMEEFAKTSIETFGLSELSAKKTASSFMAMAKGMRFPAEAASDMAIQLTALSADMASFFNITQDEARTALAAVYTGETETLKRYGILITEVNLQEYARQQGIKKSIEKMTQQEKVMLRYNYIMSATAQAQGDFARTSDSWANQTRVLSERWKELLIILGNGLIQVLAPVVRFLNTGLSYMITMAKTAGEILSSIFGLQMNVSDTTTTITNGATEASDGISGIGDAAEEAGKKAAKSVAPFDKLNIAMNEAASSDNEIDIPSVKIDNTNTAEVVDNAVIKSFDKLKEKAEPAIEALKRFKENLEPIGKFVFTNIKNFYQDVLKPIGTWVLGTGLPKLLDVAGELLRAINWDGLSTAIGNLYKAIAPFAISVGEGLIIFIETMADVLKPVISTAGDALAKAIEAIAKAIKKVPEEVAIAVGGAIGGLATAILIFKGASMVAGIIKGIGTNIDKLLSTVSKHPMLMIAAGMTAIAGALMAFDKARFDKSAIGQYVKELDELIQAASDANAEISEMLDGLEKDRDNIIAEYAAIETLADKYFELADQTSKTNEEQALMKTYAEELIKKVPELSTLIDEQTGAYKGTKTEIVDLIRKTKEYYLLQAAKDSLVEIAKQQYEAEKNLKILTEEQKTAVEELAEAIEDDNITAVVELSKRLEGLDTQVQTNKQNQERLNDEWDYATQYISDYSTAADNNMTTVESAVKKAGDAFKEADLLGKTKNTIKDIKSAFEKDNTVVKSVKTWLEGISNAVKTFQLPTMEVKIGVNTSALEAFRKGSQAAGIYVPGYASGTVVPANYGNFLAVLGDNKREPEVVSPLSTMEQAMENVLNRRGGTGGGSYTFIAQLNGKTIYEETVTQDQMQKKSTGKSKLGN